MLFKWLVLLDWSHLYTRYINVDMCEVTSQIAESHFALSQFAESILPNLKLPIPILPNILKN